MGVENQNTAIGKFENLEISCLHIFIYVFIYLFCHDCIIVID